MHQEFTVLLEYTVLFVLRGIPAIIGIISLVILFAKLIGKSTKIHIDDSLPYLLLILASVSLTSQSWQSILGLAVVCTAIIIMKKLKTE